jgi:polysaccharide pyruvyl transferase WcaK-like protein
MIFFNEFGINHLVNKKICFINIALGPFKTQRLKKLVKNIREYKKNYYQER